MTPSAKFIVVTDVRARSDYQGRKMLIAVDRISGVSTEQDDTEVWRTQIQVRLTDTYVAPYWCQETVEQISALLNPVPAPAGETAGPASQHGRPRIDTSTGLPYDSAGIDTQCIAKYGFTEVGFDSARGGFYSEPQSFGEICEAYPSVADHPPR